MKLNAERDFQQKLARSSIPHSHALQIQAQTMQSTGTLIARDEKQPTTPTSMASSQANTIGQSKISTQGGISTQSSRNATDRQTPIYQNAGAPNFRAPLKLPQAPGQPQLDINLHSRDIQQCIS